MDQNYEIWRVLLHYLYLKEEFLLQPKDKHDIFCRDRLSWSWSRKNPSSPAPASLLQLRAPLPRSPKLGALAKEKTGVGLKAVHSVIFTGSINTNSAQTDWLTLVSDLHLQCRALAWVSQFTINTCHKIWKKYNMRIFSSLRSLIIFLHNINFSIPLHCKNLKTYYFIQIKERWDAACRVSLSMMKWWYLSISNKARKKKRHLIMHVCVVCEIRTWVKECCQSAPSHHHITYCGQECYRGLVTELSVGLLGWALRKYANLNISWMIDKVPHGRWVDVTRINTRICQGVHILFPLSSDQRQNILALDHKKIQLTFIPTLLTNDLCDYN